MKNLMEIVNDEQQLTKTRANELANMIIQVNDDGHVDTLTILARMEFISQVIENAKNQLRERAIDELDLYGPESRTGVTKYGVTFKHKETAVKYDFSQTPMWNDLKHAEQLATDERKEFESTLKSIKKSTQIAIPDTGELIDVHPPIKSSKTTVEISLAK